MDMLPLQKLSEQLDTWCGQIEYSSFGALRSLTNRLHAWIKSQCDLMWNDAMLKLEENSVLRKISSTDDNTGSFPKELNNDDLTTIAASKPPC